MKYKKIVKRIFVEIYNFQVENWGDGDLPALTALLYLSILQFLNIGSLFMIAQNLTSIDIFGFFSSHLIIGMIIPAAILVSDYLIVKPISATIEESNLKRRKITWIYVLITLVILAGCIAWIIYNNEHNAGR